MFRSLIFRLLLSLIVLLNLMDFASATTWYCCMCKDVNGPNTGSYISQPIGPFSPTDLDGNDECLIHCARNGKLYVGSGGYYLFRNESGLKCGDDCSNQESSCYVPEQKLCNKGTSDIESKCKSLGRFGNFTCVASGLNKCGIGGECNCDNWRDDLNMASSEEDCSCEQKLGCCIVNNISVCPLKLTFSQCRDLAKSLNNKKYKWGGTCGDNGECEGDVQEYLKVTLTEFTVENFKRSALLKWTTSDEINSIAFHIWRGIPKGKVCTYSLADYINVKQLKDPVNPNRPLTIWTLGNLGSGIQYYSYIDKNVESGVTYCYTLEDVDSTYNSIYYLDFITSVTIE